ncbi:hypothetical protein ScalyP_jg7628 [Parmales sp. scaly parma]|nr:hypothetical protein ScalyP_jg7628 [Parmales sp. scaly parma]
MTEESKMAQSPRLPGWWMMTLTGTIVFATALNEKNNNDDFKTAFMLGLVFALIGALVVIIHYLKPLRSLLESADGKIEAFLIFFMLIWAIVSVSILTKAGGVAYAAINIYYASWLMFISAVFTTNDWLTNHNMMNVEGLARDRSKTLPHWMALVFTSLVVFGAAIDGKNDDNKSDQHNYAISLGFISFFVAALVVFAHFEFIVHKIICPGGMVELCTGVFMAAWWTVGVIILTRSGGIAATAENLYYSLWISFFLGMLIVTKWKFVNGDSVPAPPQQTDDADGAEDVQVENI